MAWERIPPNQYPKWVTNSLTTDRLHAAWERNQVLLFRGRTYEYRVTPMVISQGHWEIGMVERQRRKRFRSRKGFSPAAALFGSLGILLVGAALARVLFSAQESGESGGLAAAAPVHTPEPTPQLFPTLTPSPIVPTPTPVPPPAERHMAEKEYMLAQINKKRTAVGVEPVTMGDNAAAQLHAEAALAGCFGSHWGMDGLKPYMRYSLAGGYQANAENAHGGDYCITRSDRVRPIADAKGRIRGAIEGWMESPGHRDTMLDPMHKKVNIGLAWDRYNFKAFQHFEGDYVTFTEMPTLEGGVLSFAGEVRNGAILQGADDLGVQIFYDQPPATLTRGQIARTYCYSYGVQATSLREPAPPGWHWDSATFMASLSGCPDPYDVSPDIPVASSLSEADRLFTETYAKSEAAQKRRIAVPWVTAQRMTAQGHSFAVKANIGWILSKHGPGVYTVIVRARMGSERPIVAEYSIFHEVAVPVGYAG